MSSSEQEAGGEPRRPEMIVPQPDAEQPLDIAASAREKRDRPPSLTQRHEARTESYIGELKSDKLRLRNELVRLRYREIHHLRDDIRWLEESRLSQTHTLATLQTSYEWAIAFNWFSFALIAVGGGVVSYAAFVSPQSTTQQVVATLRFCSLLVGVALQAFNSFRGTRSLLRNLPAPAADTRPLANPQPDSSALLDLDDA